MAKRERKQERFRPVLEKGLIGDVLGGGDPSSSRHAVAPEPAPVEVPEAVEATPPAPASRTQPSPPAKSEVRRVDASAEQAFDALDERQRLTREKRYLLSVEEQEKVEALVQAVAREVGTPVKLSHLVRAALVLILNAEEELLQAARETPELVRPGNGDTRALQRFEREVARVLETAFRRSAPLAP